MSGEFTPSKYQERLPNLSQVVCFLVEVRLSPMARIMDTASPIKATGRANTSLGDLASVWIRIERLRSGFPSSIDSKVRGDSPTDFQI